MATPTATNLRVLSPTGVRDTWLVGIFRLLSAIGITATVVILAHFMETSDPSSIRWVVTWALVAGCFAALEKAYGGRAARAEEKRVRQTVLSHHFASITQANDPEKSIPPAQIIQMLTDNTERLTEYRQAYLGTTIAALLIPVITLSYIGIAFDPVVGFVVLGLALLIPVFVRGFMLVFRKVSAQSRSQRSTLSARYLDAIHHLIPVRLFGAGARMEQTLRAEGEKNRVAIMKLLAGNQVVIIVLDGLFSLILICLTTWLILVRSDHMAAWQAVAIMLLIVLTLEPLQQIAGFFYIGMGGIAAQKALTNYVANGASSAPLNALQRATRPTSDTVAVDLQNLHHDYGRGPVLQGLDLRIHHGERVAMTGRSGAGKSTLVELLRGTLIPQQGECQLYRNPHMPSDQTAMLCATVQQRTWMFTGNVADNLRMAQPSASDDALWRALEQAQVADEVRRMPNGLYTDLGEGAQRVSGGQAQRLSLARALLSERQILLLDEPTSQVDIESERRMIEAIAALPRDRTVIMMTHRLALLQLADTVYELRDGMLTRQESLHA